MSEQRTIARWHIVLALTVPVIFHAGVLWTRAGGLAAASAATKENAAQIQALRDQVIRLGEQQKYGELALGRIDKSLEQINAQLAEINKRLR